MPASGGQGHAVAAASGRLPHGFDQALSRRNPVVSGVMRTQVAQTIADFETGPPEVDELGRALNARSALLLPLRPRGALLIASDRAGRFGESDRVFGCLYAGLASHTLETGNRSVLAEKERLGAELHDGAMQLLYAAALKLERTKASSPGETVARLEEAAETVRAGLAELRVLTLEARQASLPLSERLRRTAEQFDRETSVEVEIAGADLPPSHIAIDQLSRIALEAVSNAARHSNTDRIAVFLGHRDGCICLSVEDFGKGFDPDLVTSGLGLSSMQRRAAEIGAGLAIRSEPGGGTTVEVRLPITRPAPPEAG